MSLKTPKKLQKHDLKFSFFNSRKDFPFERDIIKAKDTYAELDSQIFVAVKHLGQNCREAG